MTSQYMHHISFQLLEAMLHTDYGLNNVVRLLYINNKTRFTNKDTHFSIADCIFQSTLPFQTLEPDGVPASLKVKRHKLQ